MGLDQFKEKYPQYNNWDDQDLAQALYEKYGEKSGVDRDTFMSDIGRDQYSSYAAEKDQANVQRAGDLSVKQQGGAISPTEQAPQTTQLEPEQERQIFGLGDEDFTNYPPNPELAASQIGEPGLARAAELNTPEAAPDTRPERTWGTTWDEALKAVPRAVGESFRTLNEMSYMQSIKAAKGDPRVVERVNKARQNPDFLVKLATDPRFAAVNYKPTGKPHVDFWMDALNTAPVYGVMGLGTVVGGPAGGMIAMGTQIFGPAFEEGLQKGMTFENAVDAAIFRTAGETALEQLGFSSIMRNVIKVPGVRAYIESTVTEGTTEYLQSQLGAGVNAFILGRQRGYSDAQLAKSVLDAVKENHGQAKYEGAIGSVFGLGGTAGGKAAVSGYEKAIDTATKNLRMHLDTGISQVDPDKIKETEKLLKGLEELDKKLKDAQDAIPEQKEAEKELETIDPKLVKEADKRRLFDDPLGMSPGGPRTFEGTGPGGTPAPAIQEKQQKPEVVPVVEEETPTPEPEVEEEVQTPLVDDTPPVPEEPETNQEWVGEKYPGFKTREEAEEWYLKTTKKHSLDQGGNTLVVVKDGDVYRAADYRNVPVGTVLFDRATVNNKDTHRDIDILETMLNKKDENGNRTWRFGYLLDALENLGVQFKYTVEPNGTPAMKNARAMFTRQEDNTGRILHGIVRLKQRYIQDTANASMDIAHEILHGVVHVARAKMTDQQIGEFRSDIVSTITRINRADVQRQLRLLKGLENNSDSAILRSRYDNARAGLKVIMKAFDQIQKTGVQNIDPQTVNSIDELLTYTLTNPEAAKAMDEIAVQNPSKSWIKTLWDEFVYKVSSMLGRSDTKSAFDEVKRIMSTHMKDVVVPKKETKASAPKKVAKKQAAPKGYIYKSLNKKLANEVNDILNDYQDVVGENQKLVDKFITMAERASLREATPDRQFVDGEPALMKKLGPEEFAKSRFYINKKGTKTRWYTDNDIKNFNAFRDAAQELMKISPELVTDIEQAIGEFVKTPEKRMMPKGYVTSIVDDQVIDHPKGWVSPKAKALAKKKAANDKKIADAKKKLKGLKKPVKKAPEEPKVKPKLEPKPKAPPKVVKPKKAKPEAPKHGFPTAPGVVTLERGSQVQGLTKDPYELGYHFALGEDTPLAAHFGEVTKYTMKLTPTKFVIMEDPNTWDNWDNMIDTLEASVGKYGEVNDTKIKRLLDAFEPYRGQGAGEETIIQEMETIFNTLGLEGAFYNAVPGEGGGGPAVMFINKPKVNKKKTPKTTPKGKTKQDVKQDIKQNQDILKNIKNTKYLEKEWAKAAGELSKALLDNNKELQAQLEARIDLIKAALFGGATTTKSQASISDLWHGGPHYWSGLIPSLDKVGTGEGHQAFGWGLYFTNRKKIAKWYAEKLSKSITIDGPRIAKEMADKEGFISTFTDDWMTMITEFEYDPNILDQIADDIHAIFGETLGSLNPDAKHSLRELRKFEVGLHRYCQQNNLPKNLTDNILSFGDWITQAMVEVDDNIGNRFLYNITLHKGKKENEYVYADWYLPKEQQPKEVLDKLSLFDWPEGATKEYKQDRKNQRKHVKPGLEDITPLKNLAYIDSIIQRGKGPIGNLYERLSMMLSHNQRRTSELMLRLGIDGIKYPADSLSPGATKDYSKGTNYVVFDADSITVEAVNQFSREIDEDNLNNVFRLKAEAQLNEAAPGYDLRLEHYWPKSSGMFPYGYGFHVANPDSILHRASFTLMSDEIDPQKVRDMIAERQKIFEDARAGKVYRVNQSTVVKYDDPKMEEDHQMYRVGVAKDSWMTRIAEFFVGLKNKFREFEDISRKKLGEYAEATKELRRLRNYRGIASSKAVAKLGKILNGMNKQQYDVFERLVTMADFWEQHKINEQREANGELPLNIPFDWDKDSVEKEFKKLIGMAMNDPVIKSAWKERMSTWEELKSEYGQAMKDVGFDVEKRMKRSLYFRHQVVDYLKAKGPSTVATKKLATPANRSHLKARKGTTRPINLNYIQAEYEVMAQLLYDIQIAKTIKVVKDNFDIIDTLKEAQGEQDLENYEIPEGYVAWRPREGSVMYLADTIPSKLVEEAIAKGLKQLKVKTKDISKVLVVGRKHSEMVIPEDLAETLNSYLDTQKKGIVGRFFRSMMTGWKAWQLVSPFRVIKYNLRNMTGDAEAVFVGGQTFATGKKMFSKAGADIIKNILGKTTSAEYAEWVDRGGLESNFTTQEMADILRSPEFKNVATTDNIIKMFAKKVWKLPRTLTDAREQWMRYASYLSFLEKLESGKFKPTDYAASIPEEIDNLRDNRDKAFTLSNDLLGAYDRVTVAGDFMRKHVMPFYSFQEVNASRMAQIWRNMVANDRVVGSIARKILGKTAAKSVMLTLATGQLAVTMMFWSTLLQVFNNLEYPEEEDALPDDLRETPHIYMGPPGNEHVRYFPRVGLLGDLLEWGNLQGAPLKLADLLTGRTTLEDAKKEIAKYATKEGIFDAGGGMTEQLMKKLTGMVGPQYKVPFELVTMQKLFPDATNPTPIDDWKAHIADQFLPKEAGNLIRQRPMAKTWKSDMVESLYTYKQDLTKMAYNATKARKIQWLKDMGFRGKGYHSSEKATAAYNMSLAYRYGDTTAFKKYFVDYIKLSYGKVKDIGSMMNQLDPLYGMTAQQKALFISTLDKHELKGLELAYKHYVELRSGTQFIGGK